MTRYEIAGLAFPIPAAAMPFMPEPYDAIGMLTFFIIGCVLFFIMWKEPEQL